jgi:prepilin-type N-terminal cleavage/methylation domain-containing protein
VDVVFPGLLPESAALRRRMETAEHSVTRSWRKPGFTLLELLVVVSIVALLVSLSLPALRTAREQSRQLVCRHNLDDIWRGVYLYSLDNSDRVPYMERRDVTLDPFDKRFPQLVGNVVGRYVERRSFICPSAVAGYPDEDPSSRYKWKLTYDFSTADRVGDEPVPYDKAPGAFTGTPPDPASVNMVHFDGRPIKRLSVRRYQAIRQTQTKPPGEDPPNDPTGRKAQVVNAPSVPLVADTLAEEIPGDLEAGRPRYPHRGVVRRQADVYRSLVSATDPRFLPSRQTGYFQLHAEGEHPEVFLTRFSPEMTVSAE